MTEPQKRFRNSMLVVIRKLLHFALLHYALEKLLQFALKDYYILRQCYYILRRFLLHFALIVHFAAIITFCGVTPLRPVSNVVLLPCRTQFINYKCIRIHLKVC